MGNNIRDECDVTTYTPDWAGFGRFFSGRSGLVFVKVLWQLVPVLNAKFNNKAITMSADLVLHFANFSTLFVCLVLKFPQVFALVSAKSSRGISLKSLLLELTGYIVVLSYQSYYEYPLSAYLEYPVLIAQDVILLVLVFYYNGNLSHCLLPAVLFVAVWPLITFQKWIIDLAMSLCTFISAASKFAQLQCLWETRDAGQVSALTWGMAIYTSLARIFTTLMTTGDFQVLARFLIMLLLNGWVTATIVYYRRAGIKQE